MSRTVLAQQDIEHTRYWYCVTIMNVRLKNIADRIRSELVETEQPVIKLLKPVQYFFKITKNEFRKFFC